ncbi:MAG: hypothetical protein LC747_04860, partial [Acidobacteria bacterium]|nr:hypothetical protein [Acidobacteriota bacterium]
VESFNLDGDIDIFLSNSLRPLTKVTLYAGASSNKVTKTVYLRRDEPLILRVQARTPNDAEGTYRIIFGGAFKPAARLASDVASTAETTPANPSPTPTPARSADRKVKRVTSTGARIEEPVAEVAVKEEVEKTEETPDPPPVVAKKAPAKPRPARTRTGTRRTSRAETARKSSPKPETGGDAEKTESEKAKEGKTETESAASSGRNETEAAEKAPTPKPERARPVRVPRAPRNRNSSTAKSTGPPPAESATKSPTETPAPPAPSPRLVLVMRDGEQFVRDMSGIRRVTVENGMILIVSKNGKTERQPMSAVLRMSIEP